MLTRFISRSPFSKWSKPPKKPKQLEVQSGSTIISDERGAKLSKAEEEAMAARVRSLEEERKQFETEGIYQLKSFHKAQEKYLANNDIVQLYINHHRKVNNKYSYFNLKSAYNLMMHYPDPIVKTDSGNIPIDKFFPNPNSVQKRDVVAYRNKVGTLFPNERKGVLQLRGHNKPEYQN